MRVEQAVNSQNLLNTDLSSESNSWFLMASESWPVDRTRELQGLSSEVSGGNMIGQIQVETSRNQSN